MSANGVPVVPMVLHQKNRKRLCQRLKEYHNISNGAVLLLKGGERQFRDSSDTERLFKQDSYFHWAFGVKEPAFYGIIDVDCGKATLFAPRVEEDYNTWMGRAPTNAKIQEMYEVDEVFYRDEIAAVLASKKPSLLLTLAASKKKSNLDVPLPFFEGLKEFSIDSEVLRHAMDNCRVIKTKEEIELIHYACRVSCEGQIEVMRRMRPGMKEYQLESMFQHYAYARGGCRSQSYILTVASGPNGAIMCYGNARLPNNRTIEAEDMCLVDCGFLYHRYTSDVTCCFPASGRFSKMQRIVYETVFKANRAALSLVKPGVSWATLHLTAGRTILSEFQKHGILVGAVDDMMDANLFSVFNPFAVGHYVGVDLVDVSEYPSEKSNEPGLRCLDTIGTVKEGMVLTIEPGVYFNRPILEKAYEDPRQKKFINIDILDKYLDFGGIRLEDCVAVTADGYKLLTELPRQVEDIERIMAEGKAQSLKPII